MQQNKRYSLVVWPESQEVMGRDDVIFVPDESVGFSAYMVPDDEGEYVLLHWPDSQEFHGKDGCVYGDEASAFVPVALLDDGHDEKEPHRPQRATPVKEFFEDEMEAYALAVENKEAACVRFHRDGSINASSMTKPLRDAIENSWIVWSAEAPEREGYGKVEVVIVRCENCGYDLGFDETFPGWLVVPCPNCGLGVTNFDVE